MSRPDVALIGPYRSTTAGPSDSGVATYTANLAHALAGQGAAVTVVAPERPDTPVIVQEGGVTVRRAYHPGPSAVPVAVRAAEATQARVVHLQHEMFLYGGPSALPGLAWGLRRLARSAARTVVTCHQVVSDADVDPAFCRLHRVRVPATVARTALHAVRDVISARADTVVVHEQAFRAAIPSAHVVAHGLDPRPAPPADLSRRRLGLDPDGTRLVVLCFGYLAPYKGLEVVLDAAAAHHDLLDVVVAGGPHPRLAAAGDPYARHLQDRYGTVARFTGFVPDDDVPYWFAAADLAVLPYPRPFAASGALAHALGYATPVLLSSPLAELVGAPRELAVDAPDLPDVLAGLAADRHGLTSLKQATERLAEGRSWQEAARRHLRLYEGADG